MPPYDILIAGAGPAGCAAAYDLAQAGRRVLLLDRRHFPRPKACACGLTRKTRAALRYSVDPVIERTCNEIVLQRATQNNVADKSAEVRVRSRTPICAMAERQRFDAFCLQQTLAAGAGGGSVTFHKIETIAALREHATHIELDITFFDETNGGTHTETLTAPVLIGADGSNGQTRRLEHALHSHSEGSSQEWFTRGFALEALVPYSVLSAPLPGGDALHDLVFDFSPLPGGYGWLFPKGDHINIGVGAFAPEPSTNPGASSVSDSSSRVASAEPVDRLKAVTRQLLTLYTQQKLGVDLAAYPAATITGQHLGMGGHVYIPQGRVLLTGDAAGLVDPLTGEGIHSAIVSGQAAAAAIVETIPAAVRSGSSREVAAAYARRLAPLQQTLAFSHRSAASFYRQPERGFKAMRIPILRQLILKTYADGLPSAKLVTALAKFI